MTPEITKEDFIQHLISHGWSPEDAAEEADAMYEGDTFPGDDGDHAP